jgi:topoisomerase-4 subunit A
MILTIMGSGHLKLVGFDLATHFDEDMIIIEKYEPTRALSVVYWEGAKAKFYVKRFVPEPSLGKKELFISETEGSKLEIVSYHPSPEVEITFRKEKGKQRDDEKTNLEEFISVKGMKALGNQLTSYSVRKLVLIEPELPEPVYELADTPEPVVEPNVETTGEKAVESEVKATEPSPENDKNTDKDTEKNTDTPKDSGAGEPGEQASLF